MYSLVLDERVEDSIVVKVEDIEIIIPSSLDGDRVVNNLEIDFNEDDIIESFKITPSF